MATPGKTGNRVFDVIVRGLDAAAGLATEVTLALMKTALDSVKTNTDKIPSVGQAAKAAATPVTVATDDNLHAKVPALGTAVMAGAVPVTLATDDEAAVDLAAMSTAQPGITEYADLTVAKDAAADTLVTSVADGSYFDCAIQPEMTDPAATKHQRMRIKVGGAAGANSKWYSSADGTFRLGPVNNGEIISGYVDAGEDDAVVISICRSK